MKDKDSEALRSQRIHRKRIGRMKSAIVIIVAGWIILSMILIAGLFIQTISLKHKIDKLITSTSGAGDGGYQLNAGPVSLDGTEDAAEAAKPETEVTVPPPASGIQDTDNLAEAGDTHKVYLTFDDGPSENTAAILDILAEYDLKATFFVTGHEEEGAAELYKRIVEEGHTLGMHSYSNKYSVIYQSVEAFDADYRRLYDYLYGLTGEECRLYRFPGGSSNQISNVPMDHFIRYLNEQGVTYYDWNVSAGDAASSAYTVEELVENVTADVVKYKESVVLLHDSADKSITVEAMRPLIEALKDMDALILPIDEDTPVIQYVKSERIE